MNPETYQRASNISHIIDRTEQVEAYADGVLNTAHDDDQKLLNNIKRNTNSIKSIVNKHLDNLQRQQ